MKKLDKIIITIIVLVISLIVTVNYRVKNNIGNSATTINRTKKLASEYDLLKKENKKLKNRIEKYKKKSKEFEKITRFEELSGYSELTGDGIEVIIEENDFIFKDYQYELLEERRVILDIINTLNASGTKGISINGERYTAFTEIVIAGNNIEVNGKTIGIPYTIKAIGNSKDLENALSLKGGIVWSINRDDKLKIEILKKEVNIPASSKAKEYIDEKK